MKKNLKKPKKPKNSSKAIAEQTNVSQNCDTLGFCFKVFVSQTGSTALQKNIATNTKDEVVMQQFKARVRYLSNTPKSDWKKPQARKLKGVDDIYEIRFSANNVEHRPLGFFGPNDKEFTILIWATHKQDIYDPADAINTADTRRTHIKQGKASCMPLKIDGEEFPCAEK